MKNYEKQILQLIKNKKFKNIKNDKRIAVQNPKPGHQNKLKRLVLIGDHFQLPPVVQNRALAAHSKFDQSLFTRLVRLGVPAVRLDQQGRARPELAALFSWRYDNLGNLPSAIHLRRPNAAMAHSHQFVHVAAFQGRGETTPAPHYYQNLGEAEYAVQLFMYLRLAGYPREKIVLLATYNGQRNLLRDVARRRCLGDESKKRLFGLPAKISTVDKFQGRQSDFVILSLVRTKAVGHLRDVRRLVVALSRARRGLYVFGCRALFERSAELREAFERLLSNGDKLALVRGEHYGSPGAVGSTERTGINRKVVVSGVDEMGKIVAAMTLDSMRGEKRKWETEMSKYKSDFEKSKSAKQVEAGDLKE